MTERENPVGGDEVNIIRMAATRMRADAERMQAYVDRAKEYSSIDQRQGFFFGLSGVRERSLRREPHAQAAVLSLMGDDLKDVGLEISLVDNPPNMVNLAGALKPDNRHHFSIIGHMAHGVRHELFISDQFATSFQSALNIGAVILYALRIKTGNLFKAVGVSRTSWNQMAACSGTLEVQLLEDAGTPRWDDSESLITEADLRWCLTNGPRIFDLRKEPAFALAFDSAGEAPYLSDVRTSIARTWAGIEALFDVQHELSYRLSMYAAVLIDDNLEARMKVQSRFKSLYIRRSKAVHGSRMSDAELQSAAYQSWRLLCELVEACIRTSDKLPSPSQLDRVLLGEPLHRNDKLS